MDITVTWIGGPEDGKTFVMDERKAPFIIIPEYNFTSYGAYDPGLNDEEMIRTRLVQIDKRIENYFDDNGAFEYAKMRYVADYNKGVLR
jgi:hypothetical protein